MTVAEKASFNGSGSVTTRVICECGIKSLDAAAGLCRKYDTESRKYILAGKALFDPDYFNRNISWQVPAVKDKRAFPGARGVLGWGMSDTLSCDFENTITDQEQLFLEWVGKKAWFPIATLEDDFLLAVFRGRVDAMFSREKVIFGWVNCQTETCRKAIKSQRSKGAEKKNRFRAYLDCVQAIDSAVDSGSFELDNLGQILSVWSSSVFVVLDDRSECSLLAPLDESNLSRPSACEMVKAIKHLHLGEYAVATALGEEIVGCDAAHYTVCPLYRGKAGSLWLVESARLDLRTEILLTSLSAYLGALISQHESVSEETIDRPHRKLK